MSAEDPWDGILREGERILWQGQPDDGIYIHPSRRATYTVGLLFVGIGLFFMLPLAVSQLILPLMLFLVVWLGVSFYFVLSQSYWPAYKRRHTFYTLTDQRAILGIALPRRRPTLKTYEIDPDRLYDYIPGALGSIVFDYEDEGVTVNDVPQKFAAGFMRFADADTVWPMIQELQQEMRTAKRGQPADPSNEPAHA